MPLVWCDLGRSHARIAHDQIMPRSLVDEEAPVIASSSLLEHRHREGQRLTGASMQTAAAVPRTVGLHQHCRVAVRAGVEHVIPGTCAAPGHAVVDIIRGSAYFVPWAIQIK